VTWANITARQKLLLFTEMLNKLFLLGLLLAKAVANCYAGSIFNFKRHNLAENAHFRRKAMPGFLYASCEL
jgi:hypothetical protein